MKRGLFVLALVVAGSQSHAFFGFFFGQDAGVAPGGGFANSAMGQRDWAAVAGSLFSISAITYERDPLGAGVTPYNPLPGVTIDMKNVGGSSGVSNVDAAQLGWNTTPFGRQHLRFAPDFNAFDSEVRFRFTSVINSFSTLYTGAQSDFPGDFWLEAYRNGNFVAGMSQSKPAPVNGLTSVGHYGMVTDDPNFYFDEVRFISRGDRTLGSDHVGLDDTFFTYCNPVPEPATMAALGLGVVALLRRRRK